MGPSPTLALAPILLLVWTAAGVHGQSVNARVNGYLEHQFSMRYAGGDWTILDYDRLRMDLDARAGLGTRMSAAVVWQLYRGRTEVRLEDFLPEDLVPDADSVFTEIEDRDFLNHAYLSLNVGPVEVTAGKQYLTWGASWAYNPTEFFRPKDVLEPTYEREGVGAISTKIPLGALSDIQMALVPNGSLDTSGKVLRARHHVRGVDVSALVAELYEPVASSELGGEEDLERRITVGGDLSGEVLGLGVWGEAAWSSHDGKRWLEATVGGNYTLENGTFILLETYFNGRGEWGDSYALKSWLARALGHRLSLGQGILLALVNRTVAQIWTVGMSGLVNMGDGSVALVPAVVYAFAENVDLTLNGVVPLGPEGTEFGTGDAGGFLRGRVYF